MAVALLAGGSTVGCWHWSRHWPSASGTVHVAALARTAPATALRALLRGAAAGSAGMSAGRRRLGARRGPAHMRRTVSGMKRAPLDYRSDRLAQ